MNVINERATREMQYLNVVVYYNKSYIIAIQAVVKQYAINLYFRAQLLLNIRN